MSWLEIFSTSGLTVVLLGSLVFIGKNWFVNRLKESISAEYKKSLENYKEMVRWESVKKEKTTGIAEILSLWLLHNYDKKRDRNLINYELQRKCWELSLWLDVPILRILNKVLIKQGPAGISHKEALSAVRKLILGDRNDPIEAEDFVHFDPFPNKKE